MSQSDFVTRGQALVSAGQYQEAVKVCRLGLLGRPTTVEGRVVLGQALLALKRFDEVLAEMRVALELDHASIPAQVLKGEALLKKGDAHGAADVLQRVRLQAPNDPHIAGLVSEAQQQLGRPHQSSSHPAAGFLAPKGLDENTRNYPNHGADEEDTSNDEESTADSYTRPTSIAAPSAARSAGHGYPESGAAPTAKKKTPKPTYASPDATPSPAVLAVGDRSGTVEVDPEMDGVEVDGDDDFGALAAPPPSQQMSAARAPAPRQPLAAPRAPQPVTLRPDELRIDEPRGQVIRSKQFRAALPVPVRKPRNKGEVSSVELDEDDVLELDETSSPEMQPLDSDRPQPGPGTMVRNAVKLPSGPLEPRPSTAASRPTHVAPAVVPPPHLAQMIASAPHAVQMAPPVPLPPQPLPPRGNPIAAALPTMAAVQPPPQFPLDPAAQQSAAAVEHALFGDPAPAWAKATVAAGQPPGPAQMPMMPPQEASQPNASAVVMLEPSHSSARALKTGMRRRSRLQIIVWFVIGGIVIGGGVFAGFQIRAMRLAKQITEAREQAVALAKADTWKGWIGARDRLAGIAQASSTLDNRAALARARALVAFEFGDGLAEAKAAVDGLAGQGGLDAELAAAYLALAQHDTKTARAAADRALALAADDPAALYVSGRAMLLAGDPVSASKPLAAAVDKENRPLYALALARAHAEAGLLKEAIALVDKVLAGAADHPGTLIERGRLLAAAGQIGPSVPVGNEVRLQLQKVVAEGGKPLAEQPRGVSRAQLAIANLVLAQADYLRGDVAAGQADIRAALEVGSDDQAFAELATETLYAVGQLEAATAGANSLLARWTGSARGRIAMARIQLALGKPSEAFTYLAKVQDLKERPAVLATRGMVHLALDDADAARADFDAALKKAPSLELAIVGRTWIDLAAGELAEARQRIEPRWTAMPTLPLSTAYAAVLRRDPASKEKARAILERVVGGPPSPEVTRAQLELARIYRESADYVRAAKLFSDASKGGSQEARLEAGLLMIETRDPMGGRETLDALLKATDRPSASLMLETVRARLLAGQHAAAAELLATYDRQFATDKAAALLRWKYEREKGRLALRQLDITGAAAALGKALEDCGDDTETFLLAAEVAAADEKQKKLGERVDVLAQTKLKTKPELHVIKGKLLLGKGDEASKAYETAIAQLKETATPRRQAQGYLGRATVAYNREDDPAAISALELALDLDPSLYEGYLYYADIQKEKEPKVALEKARLAVLYNPDSIQGYTMVGTIAHKLRDKKLLDEMIRKVGAMAPNSEELRQLRELR